MPSPASLTSPPVWQTTRHLITLDRPRVMGIVNLTPDSFSDGGQLAHVRAAVERARRLVDEGADILDLGAESTRPGASAVEASQEWIRLEPVLREVLRMDVPVSVDTLKAEVMERALDLGVDIINDVQALRGPGALDAVARHPACGACLMHMQGEPRTMQQQPVYEDVVREVRDFLVARVQDARAAGIDAHRLVVDPGYGFGKSVEHNLALQRGQRALLAIGVPVLAGWSRKSTLGALTGRTVGDRLPASVAAALAAFHQGASILRVHDVAATVDALAVWQAMVA